MNPAQENDNPLRDDDVQQMLRATVKGELAYLGAAGMGRNSQVMFAFAAKFVGSGATSLGDGTLDYEHTVYGPEQLRFARDAMAVATAASSENERSGEEAEYASAYVLELAGGRRVVLGIYAQETPEDVRLWLIEDVVAGRLRRMLSADSSSGVPSSTDTVAYGG